MAKGDSCVWDSPPKTSISFPQTKFFQRCPSQNWQVSCKFLGNPMYTSYILKYL